MMADDVSVAHRFSTGDSSHRVRCVEAGRSIGGRPSPRPSWLRPSPLS